MKFIAYLALIAWMFLGLKYYSDYKAGCANNAAMVGSGSDNCPFCFEWGSDEAKVCSNWDNIRDDFISTLKDNDRIEIKAYYNPEESSDTELGRNRAIYIKSLFNKFIAEERIVLNVEEDNLAKHNSCMQRVNFNIFTVTPTKNDGNTVIISHAGNTLNSESTAKLDEVYKRLSTSNEKLTIIGHTADSKNKVRDLKQGLNQANLIKAYLIRKGISQQQLIVMSKGANQPLSRAEDEKQKNNRTQLIFTKDS